MNARVIRERRGVLSGVILERRSRFPLVAQPFKAGVAMVVESSSRSDETGGASPRVTLIVFRFVCRQYRDESLFKGPIRMTFSSRIHVLDDT
jgi:hypothetical protein